MKKNHEPASSFSTHSQNLLGGLLIGALVGIGGAFLIKSRAGEKIKRDLCDIYDGACDKVGNFTHDIAEKSEELTHGIKKHFCNNKSSATSKNFLIGSIAGGVLGISAIAWLTSDMSKGFRKNFCHTFECLTDKTREIADEIEDTTEEVVDNLENRLNGWVKIASKLIHNFSDTTHKNVKDAHMNLDKVVDWAVLGIRLFNSLKK